MTTLAGKTVFVTGAARGIGLAIALRAARDGANVIIAARSAEAGGDLPGTIHGAAEEIERTGGRALALQLDLLDETQIRDAMTKAVGHFGGIDCLINNASQIELSPSERTGTEAIDRMLGVNVRGAFLLTQAALTHLRKAANPHVLMISPPLNLNPRWFAAHLGYTVSKYGMSLLVLGMAEEYKRYGVAVNALWPLTVIHTTALKSAPNVKPENCRKPEIVADAAHALLVRDSRHCTGNFCLDEEVLRDEGVTDFRRYAVSPGKPLLSDLFTE